MTILPYNSELASADYRQLYKQSGNGMVPIFSGEKYQTGYGLGSIFGNILKAALPVVKQGAKSLGKTALRTGLNIAKDALAGKQIKDSFSDNLNQAKREVLANSVKYVTNRSNTNKKRKQARKQIISMKTSKAKRRRIANKDIFSN